jgi:hypothetical protein
MRSAGACCAKSCTATPPSCVLAHTTTNAWLFKKNRSYETVH